MNTNPKISIQFLLVLALITGAINKTFGQTDTPTRSLKIEAIDTTPKSPRTSSFKILPITGLTNKDFKYSLNVNPLPDLLKKTSGVDMSWKSPLKNKEWVIKQKFSEEDDKNLSKYMRDFFLGELKTKSKVIVIKCRDHEYVDGDRIAITINNAVIHPNLTLYGNYYTIDIDLIEGNNTINFIALNEGESSPNTAEVKVFDSNGKLLASNHWLIRTGFKASLSILKE